MYCGVHVEQALSEETATLNTVRCIKGRQSYEKNQL